jgi:peptide/nickel transport system permease protein
VTLGRYVARRLGATAGVLFGVSIVVFLLVHLVPGDAATAILGPAASPEGLATLRNELGLDQPWYVQYFDWLGRLLQGDLGTSVASLRPVANELVEKMGNTWVLALASSIIAVVGGTLVGVVAATRPGSARDRVLRYGTVGLASTPVFWLGLVLVYVFSIRFSILPAIGMTDGIGGGGLSDRLQHLLLPAFATAAFSMAIIGRTVRGAVLDTLASPYVTAARARGLSERRLLWLHVGLSVLPTTISLIGLQIGYLFSGVLFTEVVFAWPGIGQLLASAISARDIPVIQGVALAVALQFTLINLLADMLRTAFDPRVRA